MAGLTCRKLGLTLVGGAGCNIEAGRRTGDLHTLSRRRRAADLISKRWAGSRRLDER